MGLLYLYLLLLYCSNEHRISFQLSLANYEKHLQVNKLFEMTIL